MKVHVENLKKYFGKTHAVDNISFEFGSGQVFGFIGPNGAGKTTTMRILATIEEPTTGDACIDGVSVVEYPEKARKLVGYVPDTLPVHREMTVHEYIDFFARAYRIRKKQRDSVVQAIEEFTHLTDIREKLLPDLSKGMKQRVSLARALVHDPAVLIMDEPAAGLDPRARIELRELLKILASQGKAILISSHILTELAEICTGAVIIEQGRLLMAGTMEELLAKAQQCDDAQTSGPGVAPVSLKSKIIVRSLDDPEMLYRELLQMPNINNARLIAREVEIEIEGRDEISHILLRSLIERGIRVVEFKHQHADLEDIFMKVTRGEVQ